VKIQLDFEPENDINTAFHFPLSTHSSLVHYYRNIPKSYPGTFIPCIHSIYSVYMRKCSAWVYILCK
jgi:hypothetical protein